MVFDHLVEKSVHFSNNRARKGFYIITGFPCIKKVVQVHLSWQIVKYFYTTSCAAFLFIWNNMNVSLLREY